MGTIVGAVLAVSLVGVLDTGSTLVDVGTFYHRVARDAWSTAASRLPSGARRGQ